MSTAAALPSSAAVSPSVLGLLSPTPAAAREGGAAAAEVPSGGGGGRVAVPRSGPRCSHRTAALLTVVAARLAR
nr:unnamed protein product [Digitaria exilis]